MGLYRSHIGLFRVQARITKMENELQQTMNSELEAGVMYGV